MIKYFFIIIIPVLLGACKKKDNSPAGSTSGSTATSQGDVLKYSGTFSKGPYGNVSGTASVYLKSDNTYELRFNNFSSTDGPKLHVLLSKYSSPSAYTDLGKLKSTSGDQVYTISGEPDFNEYKYVFVHCVAYNHLFGTAIIQ